jgi:NADH:ubiquinone oxidoreductase subunit K
VILLAVVISTLGLIAILSKPNFMGLLVGFHLLGLGVSSSMVLHSGASTDADFFGFVAILLNGLQILGGFALGLRLFYLRKRTGLNDLRELRH